MLTSPVTKEVRTLSILISIYGWLQAVFALILVVWAGVAFGWIYSLPTEPQPISSLSATQSWVSFSPYAALILLALSFALCLPVLYIVSGACLRRGRAKWLAYVGAILALWNVPLGLALGIYTFVVLGKTENQQGFA